MIDNYSNVPQDYSTINVAVVHQTGKFAKVLGGNSISIDNIVKEENKSVTQWFPIIYLSESEAKKTKQIRRAGTISKNDKPTVFPIKRKLEFVSQYEEPVFMESMQKEEHKEKNFSLDHPVLFLSVFILLVLLSSSVIMSGICHYK